MQHLKERHLPIHEFNENDRMQNHTPAEQLGYEQDSDEEACFDHSDADISLFKTENIQSFQNLKEAHSPHLKEEGTDQRRERGASIIFSSDSDETNLTEQPVLYKRKSVAPMTTPTNSMMSTDCGTTTVSESDSKRLSSLQKRRVVVKNKRYLEFTTTEGSELELPVTTGNLEILVECNESESEQQSDADQ